MTDHGHVADGADCEVSEQMLQDCCGRSLG